MIHYHGSPITGPRADVSRFYAGRHGLVSLAHARELGVIAEVCQSFVLDNGAFTVFQKGGKLNVEAFVKWVEQWYRHPGFDWALIPDAIGGAEAENDALLADWPRHLRRAGVPVWHLHESIDRLVALAHEWPTVALGSSGEWGTPGSRAWWGRMREALNEICDEYGRPVCRLHGLRMLSPQVFTRLPLASADSTNAGVNGGSLDRFGIYTPPNAWQRVTVVADRVESHNSAPLFQRTPDEFEARFFRLRGPQ